MSCRVIDNNAYELSITPSRKRKRESGGKLDLPASGDELLITTAPITACFTNAAFSSTPKKLLAKRLLKRGNLNPFLTNPCLEVKSILDIVQEQQQQQLQEPKAVIKESKKAATLVVDNPYEVVRKPPKKKKKHIEIEEACFENPALNLELPEKQFNPFEVQREAQSTQSLGATKCFTNEALNLRGQDVPASRNPFEIPRCSAVSMSAANPDGVENLALETLAQPSNLQIGLPFTPTLGCRIDFKNLPLAQLTPSKLFAEKLVFSPVPLGSKKTPKRSLSSISEETMDIGKELDLYQLELENSINEAKLRKSTGLSGLVLVEQLEQKITFTQKLTEIVEQEEETVQQLNEEQVMSTKSNELEQETIIEVQKEQQTETESLPLLEAIAVMAEDEPPNEANVPIYQSDVVYASEDDVEEDLEDDLDFKAPAPFVRAYRRAEPQTTLTVSKESLNSNKSDTKSDASEPKKHNVKNMIRNSIRKLMHPHANEKDKLTENEAAEKAATAPTSIMSSIRQSLRRKPHKQLVEEEQGTCTQKAAEISIIDSSERTMKLKSNLVQTDYATIEELTNEKKYSIRSSLRKSTREVRQQFMKTVFHKNQEIYAFRK